MTFMSSKEIMKCVDQGKIRIAYYAIEFEQGKSKKVNEKRFVKPFPDDSDTDLDKAIRDYFFESLKGDSLYFHVGPYTKVEYFASKMRRRFRDNKTDVISHEGMGSVALAPGENVVISTNEYIELSEDIGASIYSTVSKTDIGFSHISTLIDPLWRGVLQIGVSNLSRQACNLRYLDKVCSVRFHYLQGEIDPKWERRKSWKHFANNYFESDNSSKIPISEERGYVNLWRDISLTRKEWEILWKKVKQSVNLGLIITGLTIVSTLFVQLQRLDELSDNLRKNEADIKEIEISLARLQRDFDTLHNRLAKLESASVNSEETQLMFTELVKNKEIDIHPDLLVSDSAYIYLFLKDAPLSFLSYEIGYSKGQTINLKPSKRAIFRIQYLDNKNRMRKDSFP